MHQWKRRNLLWVILICVVLSSRLYAQSKRTQAQNLVDLIPHKHAEIMEVELSTTPAGQEGCVTIAATKASDVGEKCDADEATALKTGKPFVEHERDSFDVTAPLHDGSGNLIGSIGIDFKAQLAQTEADILKLVARLLTEVEQQIPSKALLFQPASTTKAGE